MILEAFLFIVAGLYLAVCANVARRVVQTRFWPGLAALAVALTVVPSWWLTGVLTVVAIVAALITTIAVSRVAASRESAALERMEGSLIGLLSFQAMLLVASLLAVYVDRRSAF